MKKKIFVILLIIIISFSLMAQKRVRPRYVYIGASYGISFIKNWYVDINDIGFPFYAFIQVNPWKGILGIDFRMNSIFFNNIKRFNISSFELGWSIHLLPKRKFDPWAVIGFGLGFNNIKTYINNYKENLINNENLYVFDIYFPVSAGLNLWVWKWLGVSFSVRTEFVQLIRDHNLSLNIYSGIVIGI